MSAIATATRLVPDTEYDPRTARVSHCVLHHGALTSLVYLESLMAPGGRTVSAHWAVWNSNRVKKVPFDMRAFSLGSALWDSKSITAECVNESTNGWTISDASHESLAMIVAEAAQTFGFWPHRDGDPKTWTVLGHREVYTIHGASYATACPGGMDLNRITLRAQQLMRATNRSNPMHLMRTLDGKVWLVTPNGMVHITHPEHLRVIQRILTSAPGTYDVFNEVERAWVVSYLNAANSSDDAETAKILAALAASKTAPATVDTSAIVKAVQDAIAAQGVSVDLDPVLEAIRAVQANIDDQPTEFVLTPKE